MPAQTTAALDLTNEQLEAARDVCSEHGLLCLRCAYRQNQHDDRRDGIED